VISIDNHHNSHPAALSRVAQLAHNALPENATEADKESAEIDVVECDLTSPEQVRAVFEKYGRGGIWGVIHIAVRVRFPCPRETPTHLTDGLTGLQGGRRIGRDTLDILYQQRLCNHLTLADHVRL